MFGRRQVWFALALLLLIGGAVPGAPAARADDAFSFPALKLPFPAGPGKIRSGYNDKKWHVGSNAYSLDFCVGENCTWGVEGVTQVVAPTDLILIESYDYNGPHDDPLDYHIFQVAASGEKKLCMALGHFNLTAAGEQQGNTRTFRQGDLLGKLLDYEYDKADGTKGHIPHIHMGIWTVAYRDRCDVSGDSNRTAVSFTGAYAIEGKEYPIDGNYLNRAVTSTNTAVAESGGMSDGNGGSTSGGTSSSTGGASGEPKVLPIGDHPVERWRANVSGQYAFSPIVQGGFIYLSTYDENGGISMLLDPVTGHQAQQFSSSSQNWSSVQPGPDGSLLLIEGNLGGAGHALVISVDVKTGAENWRYEPGLDEISGAVVWHDLLIVAGGQYHGDTNSGAAIGVNLATRDERWRYAVGFDDLYPPVIDGDTAYFGSYATGGGAAMIALNAADGAQIWRHDVPEMWNVDSPVIAGGVAISGVFSYDIDNGGALLAVDRASGDEAWRITPGLDVVYTPTSDGTTLYAGTFSSSGNAALLAVDIATHTGRVLFIPEGHHDGFFSGDPGQDYVGSPAITGDTLYVGVGTWDADGDGALYALNKDGSVQWPFTPNPPVDVVFSPTLADGVAYVGTSDADGAVLLAIGGD